MPDPIEPLNRGADHVAPEADTRELTPEVVEEQGLGLVVGELIAKAVAFERLLVRLQEALCLRRNELLVVLQLVAAGPCKMAEVARALGISASALTGITDGLEERGLASRVRLDDDRRGICLHATVEAAVALRESFDRVLDEQGLRRWASGQRNVTLDALLGAVRVRDLD